MKHLDKKIELFYQSLRWKQKREHILKRDGYMCQWAKQYGKIIEATIVHHIFPIELYPEYAMCDWNLISLSRAAHNKMHDRTTNDLTREGKELMRKCAIANKIKA